MASNDLNSFRLSPLATRNSPLFEPLATVRAARHCSSRSPLFEPLATVRAARHCSSRSPLFEPLATLNYSSHSPLATHNSPLATTHERTQPDRRILQLFDPGNPVRHVRACRYPQHALDNGRAGQLHRDVELHAVALDHAAAVLGVVNFSDREMHIRYRGLQFRHTRGRHPLHLLDRVHRLGPHDAESVLVRARVRFAEFPVLSM